MRTIWVNYGEYRFTDIRSSQPNQYAPYMEPQNTAFKLARNKIAI